jgi:hypothetical protein
MTEDVPNGVLQTVRDHEAFAERDAAEAGSPEFVVTTTRFDARVVVEAPDRLAPRYRVVVEVPALSAAVEGGVADVVEEGWFDTLSLRLEDAAVAVPGTTEIAGPATEITGETVVVEATFRDDDADRAARTAKALVDYVEGTYAEGVIPGYEYGPPVSDLLASARHDDSEAGAGGPMPM